MTDSLPSQSDSDPRATLPEWVLGVDAATPPSSVALVRDGAVVGWRIGPFGPKTDAWILGAIDELLAEAGIALDAIGLIAAGVGPGTFTGIRVAIATAQGLSRGCGSMAAGLATLEGLARCAEPSGDRVLLTLIDARRGQLYAGRHAWVDGDLVTLDPPRVTTADRVIAAYEDLGAPLVLGTGVATDPRLEQLPRAATHPWPVAGGVALRAVERLGAGERLGPPLPVYLRDPDAKVGRNPLQRD